MRLYLIRHAQTAWNLEGRAQGHTDVSLDETGLEQARRLGSAFEGARLQTVLTSDLKRSYDTARPVAEAAGAALEPLRELRERHMGDWEGLPYEELWAQAEALAGGSPAFTVRPPGGESFADVWDRLDPVVERIVAMPDSVAVVTHGGTAALLLAKLMQGNLITSRGFRFLNASVTELQRRPEGLFMMLRYNDAAHLEGLEALAGGLHGSGR
ncbi:MAG: histidine phosphatase family protein [Fimbriimonadaceae bacterium]|nr:histidine phosphatase family protein [Chthonomonadaceae bacterium]MCO5297707.1 histidine phosphatase family protein [Fimbriimonadaceae bacterium]